MLKSWKCSGKKRQIRDIKDEIRRQFAVISKMVQISLTEKVILA